MFKKFCEVEFLQAVKQLRWWDIYVCNDANKAAEILTSKISKLLDDMAPIKCVQVHANYLPWLKDETKSLMKERNRATIGSCKQKKI